MRSFNANFMTQKNRRSDGPTPINLLKFGFATPVYLSDRDITTPGGPAYTGLVSRWGFIDSCIGQTSGCSVLGQIELSDLELEVINIGSPRFSDNFTDDDPPEKVTVELYQWFGGLLDSEKELIFRGVVRGQPTYDLYKCQLRVQGIFEKYNRKIGEDSILSADDYSGADPDDIGKMMSVMYGAVRRAPCLAVDAGGKTTIAADMTASSPGDGDTHEVSDASALPATGAFTLQVDQEKIRIASRSGNTLTLAASDARGYDSTTAVAHDKGAAIAEIQTAYVYSVAKHPVKAITAVYVDGIRQTGGYTAYTGQSGDEYTGYAGRAVVVFSTLPTLTKQVNVEIQNELSVDEGSHSHTQAGGNTTVTSGSVYDESGTRTNPGNGVDGNLSTYCIIGTIGGTDPGMVKYRFSTTSLGTVSRVEVTVKAERVNIQGPMPMIRVNGEAWQYLPYGVQTTTFTFTGGWTNDVEFATHWLNGLGFRVYEVIQVKIYYSVNNTDASPATGVGLDGDVTLYGNTSAETVIGGAVTVDAEGCPDDAAGTYTGTANALIQRPDHVFKHALVNLLGWPVADIDTATFNAAGSFYAANSYAFSLLITKPVQADEQLLRLALQCRSRFIVTPAGQAKLIVRQAGQSSAHAIIQNEVKEGSMQARRSHSDDLINAFNIFYNKDHTQEGNKASGYLSVKPFSDETSIDRYRRRELRDNEDLFYFDAVSSDAMVSHVGAYLLDYHKVVRRMPNFAVFLDNMEIEPGDIIDVTHDLDSMVGFVCEVLKIKHYIGSASHRMIDHMEVITAQN